jgi:ubiquinone/menaquinone biosynthesis C-methylase UbiE
MTPIESWLTQAELDSIYSAKYWNDIEAEREKEWWIEDGKYDVCLRYLERSNLLLEHAKAESLILELRRGDLRVLDLAAGIGWSSALLSKLECVAEVHAVEISRHRLERLFPHAVAMFGADERKIRRYLGSFYALKLPSASMDVIYLSQAFHHADRPLHLLIECDRVLKPGGRIVITGEPHVGAMQVFLRFGSSLLRRRKLVTQFRDLFPVEPETGDHYYRSSDYYLMLQALGLRATHSVLASRTVAYVADKP